MIKKLIVLGFIFNLISCAPQGVGKTELDRLERKLNDVRSFQAEQTAEISAMQEEVRTLTGRLEQIEFRQGAANQPSLPSTTNSSLDNPTPNSVTPTPQLPNSNLNAVTPPPIVPIGTLENDEQLVPHLDVQISRIFQDALYFVRRGQYRQAIPLLDQVGTYGVGKEGYMQSLFWKGVCFDGMGNNRDALAAYNSLIQSFPDTDRARLSLLRLASVFIRLGDTNTARLTLQKLIAEAPGTAEANAAKRKLSDL